MKKMLTLGLFAVVALALTACGGGCGCGCKCDSCCKSSCCDADGGTTKGPGSKTYTKRG